MTTKRSRTTTSRATTSARSTTTTSTTTIEPEAAPPPLVLALGSNLGRSEEVLVWAIGELRRLFGPLRVAPLFRSAPLSPIVQPDFLNTVVATAAPWRSRNLGAEEVLAVAKALERAAGRRRGERFGPRPLDVDLLLCGDFRAARPELTVPHPRLRERRFVLAPLAEVVPDLPLPPDGATPRRLLRALGDEQEVERLAWRQVPEGLATQAPPGRQSQLHGS